MSSLTFLCLITWVSALIFLAYQYLRTSFILVVFFLIIVNTKIHLIFIRTAWGWLWQSLSFIVCVNDTVMVKALHFIYRVTTDHVTVMLMFPSRHLPAQTTIETLEQGVKYVERYQQRHQNDTIDVLFWYLYFNTLCFYC